MPEVDAFIGLDQVSELGAIIEHVVADRRSRWRRPTSSATPSYNLRHPASDLHSRLRHAALPPHAGAHRLFENCRGLQSSLQLLRHPADARPASQPPAGLRPRRSPRLVAEGVQGDQPDQPGHDLLRDGSVGGESRAAPAGRFRARPDADHAAARDPEDRGRFLGAPALHASGALERRIDRNDRANATRSRATSTCRCSTSTKRCSAGCAAKPRRAHIEDLIVRLRAGIPGIALRTTFIVGFPGETEAEFEALLEFIERVALRAARRFQILAGGRFARRQRCRSKFPRQMKNARYRRAMTLQQKIAREMAAEKSRAGTQIACRSTVHRADAKPTRRTWMPVSSFGSRPRSANSLGEKSAAARGYDLLA